MRPHRQSHRPSHAVDDAWPFLCCSTLLLLGGQSIRAMALKLGGPQNHLENLLKQSAGPHPRDSHAASPWTPLRAVLGWRSHLGRAWDRWWRCREREGPSVASRREAGLEGHVWKQGAAGPVSTERRPFGGESAPEGINKFQILAGEEKSSLHAIRTQG